jgi:serine/threonine-protein kinase
MAVQEQSEMKVAVTDEASRTPGACNDHPEETASFVDEIQREVTVGTVVAEKYRVESILGRGGAGLVVSATHMDLNEEVALKFLHVTAGSGDMKMRFRREAQVSAKLKSEHITRVIDVGMWQGSVMYMVMELLKGCDLAQKLKAEEKLPVANAVDYIIQTVEGLAEAHALGIVHRDLKPANLFLTQRPDGSELIKILDFGISKWQGANTVDELTKTGVILGSPKYMAPEQVFGATTVDARADIWSLGAILYALLVGHSPYNLPAVTRIIAELASDRSPKTVFELRPDVPKALDAAIMRCLSRDPEQRFQNVAEFASAVLAAVDAPFADTVTGRIRATLERSINEDSWSHGGGSYASLITEAGGASISKVQKPKRTWTIGAVVVGLIAVGAIGLVLTRSKSPIGELSVRASASTSPKGVHIR